MILLEIFRVVSRFPATFYVISQKVDFLWDSVCTHNNYKVQKVDSVI